MTRTPPPVKTSIVAVPETSGSALYGMIDVLSAAGNIWQTLVGAEPQRRLFDVQIVSPFRKPFRCGNAIPVNPDASADDDPQADIVILPEIWLGPDEAIGGRHGALIEWVRRRYRSGATLYSACSGAVMLAETGLLDGCDATSHWGYEALFRRQYPNVRFRPDPNLAFADPAGRIVTAGGTTSWHDLALHIIARHASPGEAMRIANLDGMAAIGLPVPNGTARASCRMRRWCGATRTPTRWCGPARTGSASTSASMTRWNRRYGVPEFRNGP